MFIYEQDELLKFVSACLGISPIYRWADPLACHAYNVMRPEGILPWHFDSCEFTLSIMLQKPDEGGIFEYCPFIREPGNENFDEVKKVLEGDRSKVRQLKLEPGDLQIFKGRFTMHRVTKVKGNKPRYLCIPAGMQRYLGLFPFTLVTLCIVNLPLNICKSPGSNFNCLTFDLSPSSTFLTSSKFSFPGLEMKILMKLKKCLRATDQKLDN